MLARISFAIALNLDALGLESVVGLGSQAQAACVLSKPAPDPCRVLMVERMRLRGIIVGSPRSASGEPR